MNKYPLIIIASVFLASSFALGFSDDGPDYTKQLKEDSGPLCTNFKVTKSQTIFCLQDPSTKTLYQFDYSITSPSNDGAKKILILSVYNPAKKQFDLKMTANVSTDGKSRTGTIIDPGLHWNNTYPLEDKYDGKFPSDEAYFHAILTDDLYPTRQAKDPTLGPKSYTPEAKFLISVFNHLAMTPIAQQKLLESNSLPKLIPQN